MSYEQSSAIKRSLLPPGTEMRDFEPTIAARFAQRVERPEQSATPAVARGSAKGR
jgi:hypothetical protein